MYTIFDDFSAFDENRQPYSFTVERHTETANLHAGVTPQGFALKSVGNRFILNAPTFTNGNFDMRFKISYPYEIDPVFCILFGYDKKRREGLGVQITYRIGKALSVVLVSVKNSEYTEISDSLEAEQTLSEEEWTKLSIQIREQSVRLQINGSLFEFGCDVPNGNLAIDRGGFIGELIIRDCTFCTEDDLERECVVSTEPLEIPLINGGDIPYTVKYAVERIGDEYYFTAILDGGTKTRALNKQERKGQYVAEIDWMTSPYVGLFTGGKEVVFSLANGENCFVDPNIFWDCQKTFFNDRTLPIVRQYKLNRFMPDEQMGFIFGYENLLCKGYALQSGGNEFRFSHSGEQLCNGGAQGGDGSYLLLSPADKQAVSLIPSDCYERERVIDHLKYNHYFSVNEDIRFSLLFRTSVSSEFLRYTAEVQNVFETEVLECAEVESSVREQPNGLCEITLHAGFSPLSVGVYRIVYRIMYGDSEYKRIVHTFEVYDAESGVCPPLASGLPFMFSMNNEQKWLERNAFDLWNPMPSCDFGHYIACATNTPVEAEKLEVWRYLKLFGRQWFVWLAIRTCDDYLSEKHKVVLKNADYIFHTGWNTDCDPLGAYSLYPNRVDHWAQYAYNMPGVVQQIKGFFHTNPELRLQLSYDPMALESFTKQQFEELQRVCGQKLIDYINAENAGYVKGHNRQIKALNPQAKRAIYGPLPPYNNPTLTYHSLRYFGVPDNRELCDEYYSGFAIFEDYPFSCSYQTYRGPFALMTMLVNLPTLTVYPELYTGSRGGCIDGAVKYAHAPMGEYSCPPYQNSTQAFEYVYNTAYKTADGFRYWSTYGFHRGMDTCAYINEFVHNWHYVVEHKPVAPLRSIAYLVSYDRNADVYLEEGNYYNQGESGQTIVYECAREAGLPGGFGLSTETLKTLTADACDVLVIPSTAQLTADSVGEIRRLYREGVNLIALSCVAGLEDIFGVENSPMTDIQISRVTYEGEDEYVYNTIGAVSYKPRNSCAVLTVNGSIPAVICTKRTALFNTAMLHLGCADKRKSGEAKGCFVVGRLLRRAVTDIVNALSSPIAVGKNVGITLFRDENDDEMLLAVDYTPYDNWPHSSKEAIVRIVCEDYSDAQSDAPIKVAKTSGIVRELRFDIKTRGFAFIKLTRVSL